MQVKNIPHALILILGGTTEGRIAARVVDEAGHPFYYSTKRDEQEIFCRNGIRLTGGMDGNALKAFCEEQDIRLIIDAAHPFAEQLHQNVADVLEQLDIPGIRYERIYPDPSEEVIWCDDYADAIEQLEEEDIYDLLALTGVQSIAKLKRFWTMHGCRFRILDRDSSRLLASKQGFPSERLVYYHPGEDEHLLLQQLRPQAILIKDSGLSSGYSEKVEAALQEGIKVFVISRPEITGKFYYVNGEHGLRLTIQFYLPKYFALHTGLSTGTCATAAAVAAATILFDPLSYEGVVPVVLPNGETIFVPIDESPRRPIIENKSRNHFYEYSATVIKDSGDDPDVTNGLPIKATFSLTFDSEGIEEEELKDYQIMICGGEGVGIVTLPGLGLELGAPAINATPRKMIEDNLKLALHKRGIPPFEAPFVVTISVSGGEEIAARTFNPRLGIVGGISIIGTSGIVRPFSSEAFIGAIRKGMEVAQATGTPRVVINSGAKSEHAVRHFYPELPAQAFVHYGNFIGETLQIAAELNIQQITLGVMIGKAVKLAEGYLDTHSKKVVMNKEYLKKVAQESGCSVDSVNTIDGITLARELWTLLPADEQKAFCIGLLELCYQHCSPLLPQGKLTLLLISEEGEIPYSLP